MILQSGFGPYKVLWNPPKFDVLSQMLYQPVIVCDILAVFLADSLEF